MQNGTLTSKDVLESLGHESLLADVAVLLNRQEEWVLGCCEGVLLDCSDYIHELNFGSKSVAVVDDWLAIRTIPAIHCVRVCVCLRVCLRVCLHVSNK